MDFKEILRKGIIYGAMWAFLATACKGMPEPSSIKKANRVDYNVNLEEALKRGINIGFIGGKAYISIKGDPKVYHWKIILPYNSFLENFEPVGVYEDTNRDGKCDISEYSLINNGLARRIKIFVWYSNAFILSEENPNILYRLSCEKTDRRSVKRFRFKGVYKDFNRDNFFSQKEYSPVMNVRDIM